MWRSSGRFWNNCAKKVMSSTENLLASIQSASAGITLTELLAEHPTVEGGYDTKGD